MKNIVCKCGCNVFEKHYRYVHDENAFVSDRVKEKVLIVCKRCALAYDGDLSWKFLEEIKESGGELQG